jgi:hypothetical protein
MMSGIKRGVLLGGLGLALAGGTFSDESAAAERATVNLNDVGLLVPTRLTRGDREFDGAPLILCETTLKVTEAGRSITAEVHFKAEETKGDHTTVDETFNVRVFQAPAGKTIEKIDGPTYSKVSFRGQAAGFQIIGPLPGWTKTINELKTWADRVLDEIKRQNNGQESEESRVARDVIRVIAELVSKLPSLSNFTEVRAPDNGGPVRQFRIVGDTGGADVSHDRRGADDTRIKSVKFNPINVVYR